MPILNDILDNKVLGREFKRGVQEGRTDECSAGAGVSKSVSVRCRVGWAEERLTDRSYDDRIGRTQHSRARRKEP